MSEARKTVALLAGHVGRRGESRRLVRLIGRLAARGYHGRLICLGGVATMADGADGALESPWLGRPWLRRLAARQLVHGDPGPRPDLVHALSEEVAPAAITLATLWRAPAIVSSEQLPLLGGPARFDLRRCDALVVDDRRFIEAIGEVAELPEGAVHVIPPGIDPPDEGPDRGGPAEGKRLPVIGMMGRITLGAGFEVFLDAIHRIVEAGRDVEFLVAGDGSNEARIRRRAERLEIADRLTFAGPSVIEGPFWRVVDLYCQPSTTPGPGRVLASAMIAGRPCIASDLAGYRAMLGGGERGRLVPPGDPNALARAILGLLDAPDRRLELADRARTWARDRFDPDRESDALTSLYDQLCAYYRYRNETAHANRRADR